MVLSAAVEMPDLYRRVVESQIGDPECEELCVRAHSERIPRDVEEGADRRLTFQRRLVVPAPLREEVMREFHTSRVAVHLRGTKMYQAVKAHFWWPNMKRDIDEFVSRCITFQ